MKSINQVGGMVAAWVSQHQAALIAGSGVMIALILVVIGVYFWRSTQRSNLAGNAAALVVMAWTSQGIWEVARHKVGMNAELAGISFAVFEAMMIAVAFRAEEHRAAKGVPGAAGTFAWGLAVISGMIAATAAENLTTVLIRIALPLLGIGLWWVGLTADRASDTQEMKAERKRLADEREATWVHTPRTVMVRLGWMRPGAVTATKAQRDHDLKQLITLGNKIRRGKGGDRARRRLEELALTADDEMLFIAAKRVRQGAEAVRLVVPMAIRDSESEQRRSVTDRSASRSLTGQQVTDDRSVGRSVTDRRVTDDRPMRPTDAELPEDPFPVGGVTDDRRAISDRPAGEVTDDDQLRSLGRDAYRQSLRAGQPLTGAALARQFGQPNPKWGQRRIDEVRTGRA